MSDLGLPSRDMVLTLPVAMGPWYLLVRSIRCEMADAAICWVARVATRLSSDQPAIDGSLRVQEHLGYLLQPRNGAPSLVGFVDRRWIDAAPHRGHAVVLEKRPRRLWTCSSCAEVVEWTATAPSLSQTRETSE